MKTYKYQAMYRRPTVKAAEVIEQLTGASFAAAYKVASTGLLNELKKKHNKPTLILVLLAQRPD